MYTPIPMTVPYSLFFPSSCAETGHRQMSAKSAKRIRESEDAMRRDFPRDGRCCGLVIAGDDVERRREMMMFMEREPFLYYSPGHVTKNVGDTSTLVILPTITRPVAVVPSSPGVKNISSVIHSC